LSDHIWRIMLTDENIVFDRTRIDPQATIDN
jgi:hypothetical protein